MKSFVATAGGPVARHCLRETFSFLIVLVVGAEIDWTKVQFLTRVSDKSGMLPQMSALGQKQTYAVQKAMSASPQKQTLAVH